MCKMLVTVPCKINFHLCNLRILLILFLLFSLKSKSFGKQCFTASADELEAPPVNFATVFLGKRIMIRLAITKRCS